VDVYRLHLEGKGYYYDVNSLYPTAMYKPMPVGQPTIVDPQLWSHNFFGFVEATVIGPDPLTNAGYVGLLPIKHEGKLICPGGAFTGLFFSEELRFALANGYTLLSIKQAFSFKRGVNCFLDLIEKFGELSLLTLILQKDPL
jgi:hypothetical protein